MEVPPFPLRVVTVVDASQQRLRILRQLRTPQTITTTTIIVVTTRPPTTLVPAPAAALAPPAPATPPHRAAISDGATGAAGTALATGAAASALMAVEKAKAEAQLLVPPRCEKLIAGEGVSTKGGGCCSAALAVET